jgi:CDP-glucose 4,6-dehydratase
MENMVLNKSFWKDRAVFVTGHTGFKGGWLTLWLHQLGAKIHGFSLDPPTDPSLFKVAQIDQFLHTDTRGNVTNIDQLEAALISSQPTTIFHLAAQPLVRHSYTDPIGTLKSNIIGTAHILELARKINSVKTIIIVTTDKVYANNGSQTPYSEDDPLGGNDPYSASKAAAEIVTAAYRESYFGKNSQHPARIATVRAGNVIGGGDWAEDRLVPDCLRSYANDKPVILRNPNAIRPWQHVLEPLAGYLKIAEELSMPGGRRYATACNFGPSRECNARVQEVANIIAELWGSGKCHIEDNQDKPLQESMILEIDSSRAYSILGWRPRWDLRETLKMTVDWYRLWSMGTNMSVVCSEQIGAYERTAR